MGTDYRNNRTVGYAMKSYLYGFILNLQFLSIIPFPMEVPMEKKNIERSVQMFPVLGLIQGIIYAGSFYLLLEWTHLSALAIAFIIWLLCIILTGGLHLDGWMDSSDAYFSYRKKEDRLRIMEDANIGAFGVLSVIVLLVTRFLFFYEVVLLEIFLTCVFLFVISFCGKILMGMMLTKVPLAKEKGMAYFYREATQPKTLWIYPFYIIIMLAVGSLLSMELLPFLLIMLFITYIMFILLRRRALKWFGGITGDVTGASVEGAETFLWMIVWLLHYFAMG